MLLKIVNITRGLSIALIVGALVDNSSAILFFGTGIFIIALIISRFKNRSNFLGVAQSIVTDLFVTILSTTPFKYGNVEVFVQFCLVSYITGCVLFILMFIESCDIKR